MVTLPNRIRRYRMTNATLGSLIDDKVGELEQAFADILGLPIDEDVTAAAFSFDSLGRNNAILRQRGAAGTSNGVRFRDTTNGSEFLVCANNGTLEVYVNTGTEEVPVWTLRSGLGSSGWSQGLGDVFMAQFASTSVNSDAWTTLNVGNIEYEYGFVFYNPTYPSRIYLPSVVGSNAYSQFAISIQITWSDTGGTGVRAHRVILGGGASPNYFSLAVNPPFPTATGTMYSISTNCFLWRFVATAGDYFQVQAYQNSGAAKTANTNSRIDIKRLM